MKIIYESKNVWMLSCYVLKVVKIYEIRLMKIKYK